MDLNHRDFPVNETSDERSCWICCGSHEDQQLWLSPCKCKGSTKWVHQLCFKRFILISQGITHCHICLTKYRISHYTPSKCFKFLTDIYHTVNKIVMFLMSFVIGFVMCLFYGVLMISQFIGIKETIEIFTEKYNHVNSCIILPTVTIIVTSVINALININWEYILLIFIRKQIRSKPFLARLFPLFISEYDEVVTQENLVPSDLTFYISFFLPTIANLLGNYFFSFVNSYLLRTILGGLVFITVKAIFKMYYIQQNYKIKYKWTVQNYS